jgi:hypothetical protein
MLAQKTLEGFESITETLQQVQQNGRRNYLDRSHEKLLAEKYRLLEKLKTNPNDQEAKIDLDICRSKIKIIVDEQIELRISK